MVKNARNIGIILLVALGVDLIPGGGEAANTARQAVYLVFLAVLCWFASIMYRQHRTSKTVFVAVLTLWVSRHRPPCRMMRPRAALFHLSHPDGSRPKSAGAGLR